MFRCRTWVLRAAAVGGNKTSWGSVVGDFGGVVHPRLERKVSAVSGVRGVYVDRGSDAPLAEGTLLACVPAWSCPSPAMAVNSPWGAELDRRIRSEPYVAREGEAQLEMSPGSVIVAAFAAIAAATDTPLRHYLNDEVVLEKEAPGELEGQLGEEAYARYMVVKGLTDQVLSDAYRDIFTDENAAHQKPKSVLDKTTPNSYDKDIPTVTPEQFLRAHEMCESRCLSIPNAGQILGGPALVPWVDLLNHGVNTDANVNVVLTEAQNPAVADLLEKSGLALERESSRGAEHVVVALSNKELQPGEELVIHYMEPNDADARSPLFWAVRFHRVPRELLNSS